MAADQCLDLHVPSLRRSGQFVHVIADALTSSHVLMLADQEHQAQLRDLQVLRQPAADRELRAGKTQHGEHLAWCCPPGSWHSQAYTVGWSGSADSMMYQARPAADHPPLHNPVIWLCLCMRQVPSRVFAACCKCFAELAGLLSWWLSPQVSHAGNSRHCACAASPDELLCCCSLLINIASGVTKEVQS